VMELENTISQLENGLFGLPEASNEIRELKKKLSGSNNRIASVTKDLNDARRKMEDLYQEVRILRDHVKRIDPLLKVTADKIGFMEAGGNEQDELSLEWAEHGKPGYQLDIAAYKVKMAMELEKARAATLQLEREVEALEKKEEEGGGEGVGNEQEFKNLQKTLESTKERLATVERERDDEKAKVRELQDKVRKARSGKEERQRSLEVREAMMVYAAVYVGLGVRVRSLDVRVRGRGVSNLDSKPARPLWYTDGM
jgi:chromosome segregation ATPase